MFKKAYRSAVKLPERVSTRFAKKHMSELVLSFIIKNTFEDHILNFKPDIVHAHDGRTLRLAHSIKKKNGAKVVFDSHELETHRNPPLSRSQRFFVSRYEKKFVPKSDGVITVSDSIADYLSNKYGIERPEVIFNSPPVVYNTDEPERWMTWDRRSVREDLRLSSNTFLLVYTGNITVGRGIEVIIYALGLLNSSSHKNDDYKKEYHVALVGKVASQEILDDLKQFASDWGVRDRVHFLHPVAPFFVTKYIASADAAIIPIIPVTLSYEFAMPNKLFEATMAGLPILCSDLLDMEAFVDENNLGLCFDAADPEDCAEKLLLLVNDYDNFRRSKSTQEELTQRVCWETQAKKLLRLYHSL